MNTAKLNLSDQKNQFKSKFIDLSLLLINSDIDLDCNEIEEMLFALANKQVNPLRFIIDTAKDNDGCFIQFIDLINREGLTREHVEDAYTKIFEAEPEPDYDEKIPLENDSLANLFNQPPK